MGWFHYRQGKNKGTSPLRVLHTQRLVLRGFDMSDAVDVFAYAQNPKVGPMAGWSPHRSIEDSQAVIRTFIEKGDCWAIVEKKTGRVIGSIGLHIDRKREIEQTRMLGYALGEPWWGHGYATEAASEVLRYAFEELDCPIVSVYHFPPNLKSRRVIKKLGFTCEGTLRLASILPDGSLCDDVCYSMTRFEYDAKKQAAAGKRKGTVTDQGKNNAP